MPRFPRGFLFDFKWYICMRTVYQFCNKCRTEKVHDLVNGKVTCKECGLTYKV